jgi:hypothetical protein
MAEQFIDFTAAHHSALEARFDLRGRDRFPHHGERMRIKAIFIASDGAVTFYMPSDPSGRAGDGDYVRDFSSSGLDLDTINQVAVVKIGQPIRAFNLMPPDRGGLGLGPLFHPDIARLALAGKLTSLHGRTISPIIHVENGIQKHVVPARIVIWSPIVELPEVGARRLYLWTHADFWWRREQLDLNPAKAAKIAESDIFALEILLREFDHFTEEHAQRDAGNTASDILEGHCQEFQSLLDSHGEDEEIIHQWLKQPAHHSFLSPTALEIFSKIKFGNKTSDFVVRHADHRYTLVGIEAATRRIFREGNEEPTAEFNHACQQVRDWQQYVREHVHHVREVQNLPGIYEPDGRVIIGRSGHILRLDAKRRWSDLKARSEPAVFTYDEIIENVRAMAANLQKIVGVRV